MSILMKLIFKFFIAFLALTGAATVAMTVFNIPFGIEDFWGNHGFFFLIFISMFPRLTLLLSSVPFGGILWWLGFFIAPRILVATLATISYWQENPILVIISWLVALSGESGEKVILTQKVNVYRQGPTYERNKYQSGDAIEAEFTRKE